ncbi:MAG: DNA translocase FtsK [Eubacteriales bacterium]|nr:DNA translocase FtsK [Eubacteriales bacterium]MDD4475732.1 DNA translocase FtsK [Eubacteriales bacterium]
MAADKKTAVKKTAANKKTAAKKPAADNKKNTAVRLVPEERIYSYGRAIAPWLLSLLAVYLILCFIPGGIAGALGKYVAIILYGLFGAAAFTIPVYLFNIILFWKKDFESFLTAPKIAFSAMNLVFVSVLVHLFTSENLVTSFGEISKEYIASVYNNGSAFKSGGFIGGLIGDTLHISIGYVGTMITAWFLTIVSAVFMFGLTPGELASRIITSIKENREQRALYLSENPPEVIKKDKQKIKKIYEDISGTRDFEIPSIDNKKNKNTKEEIQSSQLVKQQTNDDPPWVESLVDPKTPEPEPLKNPSGEVLLEEIFGDSKTGQAVLTPVVDKAKAKDATVLTAEKELVSAKSSSKITETDELPYVFPPLSLLRVNQHTGGVAQNEINYTADKLVKVLQSFGVNTKVINTTCGPTVTRYELQPDQGVRSRSVTNLADDIALHLAATSVRIESPIPGKSAIGIEIPNKTNSLVYLRDLIDTKSFREASSNIFCALGMDVAGNPVYLDIEKMPHLLIAGATGMGKSVSINALLMSLLYKSSPDKVRLVLIDPKKVELNVYNGIPHLLVPVVTDPKKAAGSLSWAVTEMERRFSLIQEVGVRDITEYNRETKYDPEKEHLPQIVIIIDELADLMMTAPDDVENSICRLCQKARAAGIHLVIGTQRPSVDVITGLIKANIPSRIAFTVASQVDSRTILDTAGAEKLLGRGDMLYAPVSTIKPLRVQGAFVDSKEVLAVCEYIKQAAQAEYDPKIIEDIEKEAAMCGEKPSKRVKTDAANADDLYSDEMVFPAIEEAIASQTISTSLLQRRLKLGYSRAAKIIDILESKGFVSKFDPSTKGRKVLITVEQFAELKLGSSEPDEE